jgi:hypothetical protein
MKTTTRLVRHAGACCLVGFVLASTSITSGQVPDTLMKAKALYADASYDEALAVLKSSDAAEAHQYRALCLIALGRTQEAERALEALVNVAPTYAISDADLPPRIVALYTQTRRRIIPSVVKRMLTEARADFQAKNMGAARDKFEKLLTLTQDPVMAGNAEAVDLQLLAASYIDIVKNSAPGPVLATAPVVVGTFAAPAPITAATNAPGTTALTTGSRNAVLPISTATSMAVTPTAAAPSAAAAAPTAMLAVTRKVVPAETVRQSFPAFTTTAPARPMSGAVRVTIGPTGKVTKAVMEVPIEPRYDARVLAATRNWLYKPATLDDQPIQSEKVVQINIAQ